MSENPVVNVKIEDAGAHVEIDYAFPAGSDGGYLKSIIEKTVGKITLPQDLTYIGAHIFRDCENITSVTIPASVKKIGVAAFYGCSNLKEITFEGTPEHIDACFGAIANQPVINVPWSEGEVRNAPWGATLDPQINYNYKAE